MWRLLSNFCTRHDEWWVAMKVVGDLQREQWRKSSSGWCDSWRWVLIVIRNGCKGVVCERVMIWGIVEEKGYSTYVLIWGEENIRCRARKEWTRWTRRRWGGDKGERGYCEQARFFFARLAYLFHFFHIRFEIWIWMHVRRFLLMFCVTVDGARDSLWEPAFVRNGSRRCGTVLKAKVKMTEYGNRNWQINAGTGGEWDTMRDKTINICSIPKCWESMLI